jgi:hypothetical protein
MFQSTLSPIRDMNGDDTTNIVSTPYFPDSPAPTVALVEHAVTKTIANTIAKTKLCLRLFEDSSEWTTDSSSNDWTTDSEAESDDESEIPFGWCATP